MIILNGRIAEINNMDGTKITVNEYVDGQIDLIVIVTCTKRLNVPKPFSAKGNN